MKISDDDLIKERTREDNSPAYTFLFTALTSMSEILINSQTCQDIKRFLPNSEIIFIVDEKYMQVAQGMKEVDEVYGIDRQGRHKGILGFLKFLFEFKHKGQIDFSINTFSGDFAILLATFLGVKEKHTFPPSDLMLKFEDLLNIRVHLTDKNTSITEEVQMFLDEMVELDPYFDRLDFKYPQEAMGKIEDKLSNLQMANYPLIAVAPCSRKKSKCWNPEAVAELLELAYADGKRLVIVGNNEDKWFADRLRELTNRKFADLTGQTSINEVAALANRCQAIVAAESGVMHLAYASGARTVCLFLSSEDFYKWAPKKYSNTVIVHRPEGVNGEKCYEFVKMIAKTNEDDELD